MNIKENFSEINLSIVTLFGAWQCTMVRFQVDDECFSFLKGKMAIVEGSRVSLRGEKT